MSENPTPHGRPDIAPTDSPPLPRESKVESSAMSQDRRASTPRPPREPEKKEEKRGDITMAEEMGRSRRGDTTMTEEVGRSRRGDTTTAEDVGKSRRGDITMTEDVGKSRRPDTTMTEDVGRSRRGDAAVAEDMVRPRRGDPLMAEDVAKLRRELDRYKREVSRLRDAEEYLRGKCERREKRLAELRHEYVEVHGSLEEALETQTRQTRATQERLKQTEQLLDARTAELSGAQAFLSTADRLSEMEVLSIVRDLNENIYQLAVNLTEEWEKLESSQPTGQPNGDPTSQPGIPVLIQLTRNRDSTGLTYTLQSDLCFQAMNMTSSWAHDKELGVLRHIYKRLSASEVQAISARWRSLTHTHLSPPPPHSGPLVERMAGLLSETGSFSSLQHSLDFVRTVALERIESMIRTTQRLEAAFMVDVTSSDMFLLYEPPGAVFDEAGMTNEFGSDSASKPGMRDRIAGTTEVGLGKSICGGRGEPRREEILLKPKVVLEKDVVGDGK